MDEACEILYDFSYEITAPLTLYAKWSEIEPSVVSFESNGGSEVQSQNVTYGDAASVPISPTMEGSTFVAWYSDIDCTIIYSFTTPVTEDIKLYAKWSLNRYTVTFNSNGGSSISSQSIYYNNLASEPSSNPTRSGYIFLGWYEDSAFTTVWDFSTLITENTTIYARWQSMGGEAPDFGVGDAW